MKLLVALFSISAAALAQTITVKTGLLLDGKGHVLKNKEIVIAGGKIAAVRDATGPATYDLSRFTASPGWIDTHVHLAWHFNKENRLDQGGRGSKETPQLSALYAAGNANATLLAGFTTVQSVVSEIDGELRDLIDAIVITDTHGATPLH